ncbi:3'-5' exonuclease [Streptomyces africanus]|uniref:3'-5' exonuclease n=1 Tax=Streptomyces africanus TaxID=231024 RepID=UPI000A3C296C|nr:3'-5' exonuclease [Streptomyces africanus]
MTDTTTSLPVYERRDVPEQHRHLRTMTELKKDRMKPADGQEPVALLRVYRRGHGWGEFPLYDPAGAVKMRPLSAKQRQAMEARRTCPECREVRGYVVYTRCSECRARAQQEAQDRQARTCERCRREAGAALPKDVHGWPACDHCRIRYAICKQLADEREIVWRRTCPGHPGSDCTVQTATDDEVNEARAAGTWLGPRRCPPCDEAYDRWYEAQRHEAVENERRAEEARRREVAELSAWAWDVLADPGAVVLDTETTGLHDEARIVNLAVLTVGGDVLVDTLLDPGEPIPAEATDVHGIADADVRGQPRFGDVLVQLTGALVNRRCLIYNRAFDVGRLRHELTLHYRAVGHDDPAASVAAWLESMRFEDAMVPYSDWVGEWSDYHGDYRWQPLYGGDHRASSDCRAVVDRLREMAAGVTASV